MKSIFENIYAINEWGNGSGEGSFPDNTIAYRNFLSTFIKNNNITSVVDYGCGDWQFSKFMCWKGIQYTGIDIVKSVIDNNIIQYSEDNIHFELNNTLTDELPKADLLIVKDVLQHWSNKNILKFIPKLDAYKYSLLTNCHLNWKENKDIKDGQMRVLDLKKEPFNLDAELVYIFTNDYLHEYGLLWEKYVYLYKGKE